MKHLALTLAVVPVLAFAGGDFTSGKITSFSGGNGHYKFTFDADKPLVGFEQCKALKIEVVYARVPWYSWLPYVHSSHPTKNQTAQAATLLEVAHRESTPVLFGYMGSGLIPSGARCEFNSKGLSVEGEGETQFVLSYHDPI